MCIWCKCRWCAPKLLDRLKCEFEAKTMEEQGVGDMLPGSQHFGGRGACWSSGMGLEEWQALNHSHGPAQNQTTSWLVHGWSTFGARTSHGQIETHKIHHSPDLGEATTFPFILYFVTSHGTNTQMSFCLGTPKWVSRNSHNCNFCNFRDL